MYKRLEYFPGDTNGVEIELVHPGVLTKTASMTSDLQEFITALLPKPKKVYILVNALSAGEYYGSNRNGDYMAEEVLQKYHKHFEEQGHVFKHHKNKDPKTSLGKVMFSSYNPDMHRVELVCELNENDDEMFIQRIKRGQLPAVSMGMRTPYDECSICHNKAKSTAQYCDHLRYEMNKVHSNGQKVYAINPQAKFFDISFVTIPADATAGVMRKVAGFNDERIKSAAELGEDFLRQASLKEADLDKVITSPATAEIITKDPKGNIFLSQPTIPRKDIKSMVKSAHINEVMSSLLAMRIMPKPIDFQNIVLESQGHGKFAEFLQDNKILLIDVNKETVPNSPKDISLEHADDNFIRKFAFLMSERTLSKPLVAARMLEKIAFHSETIMEEEGNIPDDAFYPKKHPSKVRELLLGYTDQPELSYVKNPVVTTGILSGMFAGYHKVFNDINKMGKFDAFLMKRP